MNQSLDMPKSTSTLSKEHDPSDEFELKFPKLSRAERVPSQVKPSQAELGHSNFQAETELTNSWS